MGSIRNKDGPDTIVLRLPKPAPSTCFRAEVRGRDVNKPTAKIVIGSEPMASPTAPVRLRRSAEPDASSNTFYFARPKAGIFALGGRRAAKQIGPPKTRPASCTSTSRHHFRAPSRLHGSHPAAIRAMGGRKPGLPLRFGLHRTNTVGRTLIGHPEQGVRDFRPRQRAPAHTGP